jgi:hypothetical protein
MPTDDETATHWNPQPHATAEAGAEIRSDDFAFVYLDVDFPPIAWLVYRGVLNSCDIASVNPGNLSWFLMDTIKRGLVSTLRREGILEGIRLKEFCNCLSRLRCVYAYPSLEMAKRGDCGREKFRSENLVTIAPAGTVKSESHDSNWITDFDSLLPDVAEKYWAGELTQNPLTEYLLSGRLNILGTTVRRRAYQIIKQGYPNSLAMLELSRLAAEFGSDLGSIAPWVKREGDRDIVSHIIHYTEPEGLDVFRQAIEEKKRNPNFQVNWADLEPLCKSGPDLELDARFACPDFKPYEHELRRDKLAELNEFI